jgi:heat shock protein HslJ
MSATTVARLSVTAVVAVGVSVLLLTGCGSGGDARIVPGTPTSAGLDGAWTLTHGSGPAGALRLVAGHPVTLTLEATTIGGIAACNHYGGRVDRSGDGFVIGDDLVSTEMACAGEGVMELESSYLQVLGTVRTASLDADTLVLRGDGVELTFSRDAPVVDAPLEGTRWIVQALLDGDTAASLPLASDAPTSDTLQGYLLLDGGRLTGSTGCRTLTATYTVTSGRLAVRDLTLGKRACEPAYVAMDAQVVAVLTAGPSARVARRSLTLTTADGLGLSLAADAAR